ncbi:unnamed protein product, partial [Allacma fusca]
VLAKVFCKDDLSEFTIVITLLLAVNYLHENVLVRVYPGGILGLTR